MGLGAECKRWGRRAPRLTHRRRCRRPRLGPALPRCTPCLLVHAAGKRAVGRTSLACRLTAHARASHLVPAACLEQAPRAMPVRSPTYRCYMPPRLAHPMWRVSAPLPTPCTRASRIRQEPPLCASSLPASVVASHRVIRLHSSLHSTHLIPARRSCCGTFYNGSQLHPWQGACAGCAAALCHRLAHHCCCLPPPLGTAPAGASLLPPPLPAAAAAAPAAFLADGCKPCCCPPRASPPIADMRGDAASA